MERERERRKREGEREREYVIYSLGEGGREGGGGPTKRQTLKPTE